MLLEAPTNYKANVFIPANCGDVNEITLILWFLCHLPSHLSACLLLNANNRFEIEFELISFSLNQRWSYWGYVPRLITIWSDVGYDVIIDESYQNQNDDWYQSTTLLT